MSSTAVAKTEENWRVQLQKMEEPLSRALPAHIPAERFVRATETAVMKDPALLECNRKSLFQAVMQSAECGLMPNGRDAALVRYQSNVQFIPMIGGILKLMRNTGEIASIVAEVVCANDDFDFALGSNPHVSHKPPLNDRGEVIGAYASVRTKDGAEYIEVMGIDDLKKIQRMSRAKNGPWNNWYEEMCRKTVLRRLAKKCPLSTDTLLDLTSRDDHMYDLTAVKQQPTQSQIASAKLRGEPLPDDDDQDIDDKAPESPADEQTGAIDVEAEEPAGEPETQPDDEQPALKEGAPFQSVQEAMDDLSNHIRDTKDADDMKDRYGGWKMLVEESFVEPASILETGLKLANARRTELKKAAA